MDKQKESFAKMPTFKELFLKKKRLYEAKYGVEFRGSYKYDHDI